MVITLGQPLIYGEVSRQNTDLEASKVFDLFQAKDASMEKEVIISGKDRFGVVQKLVAGFAVKQAAMIVRLAVFHHLDGAIPGRAFEYNFNPRDGRPKSPEFDQ